MEPVVDGLKQRYKGKADIRTLNIETDKAAEQLARDLGLTGVPEFYFFNSEGLQAGKIVGGATAEQISEVLDGLK